MTFFNRYFYVILGPNSTKFSRNIRGFSPKYCQKKSQSQYYLVKNYPSDKVDNKLDRKRVHKRRRKIRKPVKGLR